MLPRDLKADGFVYLTPKDVAEILQVKIQTVYTWSRNGDGPPYWRIGPRMIRYRSDEFEVWLASTRANQEPKRRRAVG